jgi:hypothetical protein
MNALADIDYMPGSAARSATVSAELAQVTSVWQGWIDAADRDVEAQEVVTERLVGSDECRADQKGK